MDKEAELAQVNADLEWWEAAFGRGNVVGWTYRLRASVDWARKRRSVDAALRNWLMQHTTQPISEIVVKRIGLKQEAWDMAEAIAVKQGMSVDGVILQALRVYQMHIDDPDMGIQLDVMFEGIRDDED